VPRVPKPALTALAGLALLALPACSGNGGGEPAVSEGNAEACPTDVVDVVVSVSQWSDLVRVLGGDCVNVTTVASSGAVDPHDFEPGTSDLAAFSAADLVVVNGAHYDEWAEDAVASVDPEPAVVSAADVAGVSTEGSDPHLWADPAVVPEMAATVTAALVELAGDGQGYFDERQTVWNDEARGYLAAVDELRTAAAGRTYAATEGVYDRMADAVGLTDVTPAGYQRSASNESDPAPGDLAAFEAALADGSADVLIYNTQTSGSVPERLRAAAEDAGIPVVEVTESPEDAAGSFVEWQYAQVQQLSEALSGNP
jgi:zinc/manganese transport system substrate-binding protein